MHKTAHTISIENQILEFVHYNQALVNAVASNETRYKLCSMN